MVAPVLPGFQFMMVGKESIAPVHPDCHAALPLSLMGFADWHLHRIFALGGAVSSSGFANLGLTCLAITS
jgi:hypothetical protein